MVGWLGKGGAFIFVYAAFVNLILYSTQPFKKNVDTAAVVYGALEDEVATRVSLSLLLCLSLAVHLSGSEGVSVSRRCCWRIGFSLWWWIIAHIIINSSVCLYVFVFLCPCGRFYFNSIWVGFLCFILNCCHKQKSRRLVCAARLQGFGYVAFKVGISHLYFHYLKKINFARFFRPLITRVDGSNNMASMCLVFLCKNCLSVTCCHRVMSKGVWIVFYLTNQLINCHLTTLCLLVSHLLLQRWLFLPCAINRKLQWKT